MVSIEWLHRKMLALPDFASSSQNEEHGTRLPSLLEKTRHLFDGDEWDVLLAATIRHRPSRYGANAIVQPEGGSARKKLGPRKVSGGLEHFEVMHIY